MKRILLTTAIVLFSMVALSQTYQITFTAEGDATTVDEVHAKNLTTNESITLPGSGTLTLQSTATHINGLNHQDYAEVFTNLSQGYSEICLSSLTDQEISIQIIGLDGLILTSHIQYLQYGSHVFRLTGESKGIYLVRVLTNNGIIGLKFFQSKTSQNRISYYGNSDKQDVLKASRAEYILNFSPDDIISYTLHSGAHTTVVNEVPGQTKTITATMVACTDFEGNNYKVVTIGNQVWMAENLKSTKYSDGTAIPLVTVNSDWNALSDDYQDTDRAYCFYNNDGSSHYGGLYTWAAAMDGANYSSTNPSGVQGTCPAGWHLPSYMEWQELIDFLGGDNASGPKLKATGIDYWDSPNDFATNESGFTALPGGYRDEYGDFNGQKGSGAWWNTDRASTILGYSHWLHAGYEKVYKSNVRQSRGLSIRCVKD